MPRLPRYVVLIAFLFCFPTMVFSKSLFVADENGVKITLTDEPCQIQAVSNLPYRATWEERGKSYEGCFGLIGEFVAAYFSGDRSVAVIPAFAFKKLLAV